MTRATSWLTAAAVAVAITPVFGQQPPPPAPSPQPQQQQTQPADTTQDAARGHLVEARRVLSEITTMPQAAQLQGEARTQVAQLITNFNALITAQDNWGEKYTTLEQNLNTLLGNPGPTGTSGTTAPAPATGTSGTAGGAAAAVNIDPAIRAKLEEFRTHLTAFKAAAGSTSSEPSAPSAATPPSSPDTPPSAPPSNPPSTTAPPSTTTTDPPAPPATTTQPDPENPPTASAGAAGADVLSQIDDIEKSLDAASCDATKLAAIRAKLAQLRQAVREKK